MEKPKIEAQVAELNSALVVLCHKDRQVCRSSDMHVSTAKTLVEISPAEPYAEAPYQRGFLVFIFYSCFFHPHSRKFSGLGSAMSVGGRDLTKILVRIR